MKTIEEQAREYIKEYYPQPRTFDKRDLIDAFESGAEAAMRWIPVEKELPLRDSMCAISHASSPYPITAIYVGNGSFCTVESGILIFKDIHWLPIPPIPEK